MKFKSFAKSLLVSAAFVAGGAASAASFTVNVASGAVSAYVESYTIDTGFTGDISGTLSGTGGVTSLQLVALDGDVLDGQGPTNFSFTGLTAGTYELYAYFKKTKLAGALTADVTLTTFATMPNPPTPSVPEPESIALVMAGLAVVGFTARRRRAV